MQQVHLNQFESLPNPMLKNAQPQSGQVKIPDEGFDEIKEATSFRTGGSNMPPAYCI